MAGQIGSKQHHTQFLKLRLSQRGPLALPYVEDTKWHIRQHPRRPHRRLPLLGAQNGDVHPQRRSYRQPPPARRHNPDAVSGRHLQHPRHHLARRDLPSLPALRLRQSHPGHGHQAPSRLCQPLWLGIHSVSAELALPHYSSGSYARPVIPPTRTYPPSPYGSSGSFSRAQTDDPTEVYKRNAINKLVEMVHGDMAGLRKTREAEMDGLVNAQMALRQRSEQLGKGLKEMLDEKEGLEQQLQMVLMNSDVLEGWLRQNEGKAKGGVDGGVDVDDAFECVDVLSKQMLECTASDLAIEDVVYSLDKAVQDGAIPFDQYLRTVRLLSREQFFHRATAAKVRAVQMQSQVANMAARLSHYVAS
ncbi:hypothetical protein M0R45_019980 [Rubus argutus]|uniref:SB domain-containing protein n=1 Tax=Rubus argutus TaxID=59490 RepID=A0AAW1X7X5_RUBAR